MLYLVLREEVFKVAAMLLRKKNHHLRIQDQYQVVVNYQVISLI